MKKFPYRCSKCQSTFYAPRVAEENLCCEGAKFIRLTVIHLLVPTKERGRNTYQGGGLFNHASGSDVRYVQAPPKKIYKKKCPTVGGASTTASYLATCYECCKSVDTMKFEDHKFVPVEEPSSSQEDEDGTDLSDNAPPPDSSNL